MEITVSGSYGTGKPRAEIAVLRPSRTGKPRTGIAVPRSYGTGKPRAGIAVSGSYGTVVRDRQAKGVKRDPAVETDDGSIVRRNRPISFGQVCRRARTGQKRTRLADVASRAKIQSSNSAWPLHRMRIQVMRHPQMIGTQLPIQTLKASSHARKSRWRVRLSARSVARCAALAVATASE